MLEIRKINTKSPEYPECERIWEESFPPEERPDVERLRHNVDNNQAFTFVALVDGGHRKDEASDMTRKALPAEPADWKTVGMMTWWDFGDFIYGEHFAVSPVCRGKGIGESAFRAITSSMTRPLVIEVEVPSNDNPMAERRIGFYRRCGMYLSNCQYSQPSYRDGCASIPMRLMTSDSSFELEYARNIIYHNVYGCETI